MRLVTLEQIAEAWQVAPDWLRRRLPGLCHKHGFPRPVPGLRGVVRFDPAAIEAWIAAPAEPPTVAITLAAANDPVEDDPLAAELAERGKRIARAGKFDGALDHNARR